MTQKRVSRTSSNGPPRNYRGALEVNLKTYAKGTKLRVYTFIAIADLVSHQSWYTNSGTTNHVSTKLSNFSLKSYYHGENKLVIDNGNKLPITHVGQNEIPSLSSHFYLRNIPLVP